MVEISLKKNEFKGGKNEDENLRPREPLTFTT